MLTDKMITHFAIAMGFLGLGINGAQAMEPIENVNSTNTQTENVLPTTTTTSTVNQEVQTIEEDVKGFCMGCLSFLNTANSVLQQVTVTTLMLTQNLGAYEALLGKGLNTTNIAKFQEDLKKILGVTSLNTQDIKLIQNVISGYPTPGVFPPEIPSTMKTFSFEQLNELKELKEQTQPHVTRTLLYSHPTDLQVLIRQGMTVKNFTKKAYFSRVMTLAGFADLKDQKNKKNISLVKNALRLDYSKK